MSACNICRCVSILWMSFHKFLKIYVELRYKTKCPNAYINMRIFNGSDHELEARKSA